MKFHTCWYLGRYCIKFLTSSFFQEVVLSYNEIRSDGGVAIARVCGSLQSVTKLHLDGNHFGDEGKKEVEEALGSRISVLTGF